MYFAHYREDTMIETNKIKIYIAVSMLPRMFEMKILDPYNLYCFQ